MIPITLEMDSDDIAETVAIAKQMLRKKKREEIINDSFNRYTFDENPARLPVWFRDEESRHNKPQLPVTKDMIEAEKARLREFDTKTPRKVHTSRYVISLGFGG